MKKETTLLTEAKIEELFKLYFHELGRYALKFSRDGDLSEEIVQDVFIKLFENKEKYRNVVNWKSYLLKAVKNACIDYLRKKKYDTCSTDEAEIASGGIEPPHQILQQKELASFVELALKDLPEGCYSIFALKRFEGLTTKETAEKLGLSPKTVECQMTIAMKKIRAFLAKYDLP
jgi:RNA polymerase sigma-70 factor (ECF subfamily)